mmetsp:Transcript_26256/g.66793  ORF Transcript_26256/g.66793 Transcript_26256/m.66793 type:complete len:479 (-) Transcript_26256:301-1737(-)
MSIWTKVQTYHAKWTEAVLKQQNQKGEAGSEETDQHLRRTKYAALALRLASHLLFPLFHHTKAQDVISEAKQEVLAQLVRLCQAVVPHGELQQTVPFGEERATLAYVPATEQRTEDQIEEVRKDDKEVHFWFQRLLGIRYSFATEETHEGGSPPVVQRMQRTVAHTYGNDTSLETLLQSEHIEARREKGTFPLRIEDVVYVGDTVLREQYKRALAETPKNVARTWEAVARACVGKEHYAQLVECLGDVWTPLFVVAVHQAVRLDVAKCAQAHRDKLTGWVRAVTSSSSPRDSDRTMGRWCVHLQDLPPSFALTKTDPLRVAERLQHITRTRHLAPKSWTLPKATLRFMELVVDSTNEIHDVANEKSLVQLLGFLMNALNPKKRSLGDPPKSVCVCGISVRCPGVALGVFPRVSFRRVCVSPETDRASPLRKGTFATQAPVPLPDPDAGLCRSSHAVYSRGPVVGAPNAQSAVYEQSGL